MQLELTLYPIQLCLFALFASACSVPGVKHSPPAQNQDVARTNSSQGPQTPRPEVGIQILRPRILGKGKSQHLDRAADLFARQYPQVSFLTFDLPSEPDSKTWDKFNQALMKFSKKGPDQDDVRPNAKQDGTIDQAIREDQRVLFSPPDSAMTRKWLATRPRISGLWTQVLADERVDQELRELNSSPEADFRHVFLNSRQYLANFKLHRPAFFKRPIWVLRARGPGTDYFDASLDELRKQADQIHVIEFSNHELLKAWSDLKIQIRSQPISLAVLSFRHEGLDSLRDDPVFIQANKLILYGRRFAPFAPSSKAGEETHVHFWIPFLGPFRESAANDNCEFVRSFRDAYGNDPDFHAAYFYAGLQILLKSRERERAPSPSSHEQGQANILGTSQFDSMGRIRDLIYPAFVNWSPQGMSITLQRLRSDSKNSAVKICEDLVPKALQGQRIQLNSLTPQH